MKGLRISLHVYKKNAPRKLGWGSLISYTWKWSSIEHGASTLIRFSRSGLDYGSLRLISSVQRYMAVGEGPNQAIQRGTCICLVIFTSCAPRGATALWDGKQCPGVGGGWWGFIGYTVQVEIWICHRHKRGKNKMFPWIFSTFVAIFKQIAKTPKLL